MHFFAHMYGSKIGQLAVKENNSNSEFMKLTGNQGRHWFEVKANIPEGKNMLVSGCKIPLLYSKHDNLFEIE